MSKKLLIITILHTIVLTISAQSAFSFYGPADYSSQRDVYGEAMGGTGSGDLFRVNTGYINPATSVSNTRTYFSTAVSMGNVTYGDGLSSTKDNQFYLPYFNAVFLYKQNRYGFAYQNIASGNINTALKEGDGTENTLNKKFSLYKAGVFWANRNPNLNFGVAINYLFGHDVTFARQSFENASDTPSTFEIENSFRNPMFTFGITKNYENLSWGFVANYPLELQGETVFRNNTVNDELNEKAVFQYPPSANVGLTYKINDMFYVSADADYELWGQTDSFENPVDTIRSGVGFSWSGIPLSKVFFWKFPVRAGVSYRNLPFQVNDNNINEIAYHMGFSIPLKSYDSYLDIAGKYYTRGDASTTGYEDTGFLLSIGIKGFDFFRTPPNRKAPRDVPKTYEDQAAERGRGRGNRD